ncbi:MAG: dihydropteroate synthase [Desulfobacteraceae bacterium]|jgi:5-methyltetrahydrofolate--homocysteine methyltransferase
MTHNLITRIASKTRTVEISRDRPTTIIGERINPTGRKKLYDALAERNFELVRQDALNQVAAGATVLDVNAGIDEADEPTLLQEVMRVVTGVTDVPLCIDTSDPKALSAALSIYEGKALVNSVNGEERSLKEMLPLVKEHGAAVVGLCMDEDGIPETPEKRLAVAAKIIERAGKLGIELSDVVIDPLVLTIGTDSVAGYITLETAARVVKAFGVNITMGASNVSFGLPDRPYVNSAFMAMAIQAGLTCPITNPLATEMMTAILAADLVMGRDEDSMRWIKAYRDRQKAARNEP